VREYVQRATAYCTVMRCTSRGMTGTAASKACSRASAYGTADAAALICKSDSAGIQERHTVSSERCNAPAVCHSQNSAKGTVKPVSGKAIDGSTSEMATVPFESPLQRCRRHITQSHMSAERAESIEVGHAG
jgi:hypothetical protein